MQVSQISKKSFRKSNFHRFLEYNISGLIIISPLSITISSELSLLIILGLSLWCFCLSLAIIIFEKRNLTLPLIGIAGLLVCVYTFIQGLPLSESIISFLSPKGYELRRLIFSQEVKPIWTLSLEPDLTFSAFLKLSSFLLLFIAIINTFRKKSSLKLLQSLFFSGVLVTVLAILQFLFHGSKSIIGSDYQEVIPIFFSNEKHLAGFLSFMLPVAFTLAFSAESSFKKTLYLISGAGFGLVVLLTFSRSGIAVFTFAGFLFAFLYWLIHREYEDFYRNKALPLAGIIILTVSGFLVTETVIQFYAPETEVWDNHFLTKQTDSLPTFIQVISDYKISGIGKDSLPAVFQRYKTSVMPKEQRETDTGHADNIFLQFYLDYGIIVASLFLIVVCCTCIFFIRYGMRHIIFTGMISSFASILLHNQVDHTLELHIVAIPTVIITSIFFSYLSNPATPEQKSFWYKLLKGLKIPPQIFVPVSILFLALIIFAIPKRSHETFRDRSYPDISEISHQASSASQLHQDLQTLFAELSKHPSDNHYPLLIANVYKEKQDFSKAIAWYSKALYLNPVLSEAHFLLGSTLYQMGQIETAQDHFREANQLEQNDTYLHRMIESIPKPGVILHSLPLDSFGHPIEAFSLQLAELVINSPLNSTDEIITTLHRIHPESFSLSMLYGKRFIDTQNYQLAQKVFNDLMIKFPNRWQPYKMTAFVYYQTGDFPRSLELINRALQLSRQSRESDSDILLLKTRIQIRNQLYDEASQTLNLWKTLHYTGIKEQAFLMSELSGELFQARQKYSEAIIEYQKVLLITPSNLSIFRNMAFCFEQLKKFALAIEYYQRAYEIDHDHLSSQKIDELKRLLVHP